MRMTGSKQCRPPPVGTKAQHCVGLDLWSEKIPLHHFCHWFQKLGICADSWFLESMVKMVQWDFSLIISGYLPRRTNPCSSAFHACFYYTTVTTIIRSDVTCPRPLELPEGHVLYKESRRLLFKSQGISQTVVQVVVMERRRFGNETFETFVIH
jgi:hypothetical protein